MGRWTQYDEDDYRLPEGMKRVGYDADSGRYYFRDSDGSIWRGGEGVEFGEMTRVNSLPPSLDTGSSSSNHDDDDDLHSGRNDLEASPRTRNGGYELLPNDQSNPMARTSKPHLTNSPYRTLFPFFLIIAVVLLLIWRLILSPSLFSPPSSASSRKCPEIDGAQTSSQWIQPGDNCWELAKQNGWTLDKFKEANPKVNCDPLIPGTSVCLPLKKDGLGRVPGAAKTGRSSTTKRKLRM